MSDVRLAVSEIFGPTIQGEGCHSGRRAIFVRFAGCDSRCEWCDTAYAKTTDGCEMLTADEIVKSIKSLGGNCGLVVITGGNPCLQDLGLLVARLKRERMEVHVETQGTVVPYWLDRVDLITICPKIRHASDVPAIYSNIKSMQDMAPIQLKYVVFNEGDYQTAQELARAFPIQVTVIQPGWDPKTDTYPYGFRTLAERVSKDSLLPAHVRFMPQLHRLAWGGIRGV
jgi:7-carboxy-7-deazaguanine synthase